MKKKIYSAPQQKVVIQKSRTSLLAGSGEQLQSFSNGGEIDAWSEVDE